MTAYKYITETSRIRRVNILVVSFFFYADGRNFDSFIAILGMFGSGNNHFRIRISNLKQSMGVLVALLSNFVYIIVIVVGYVACRCLRHFSGLR